MKDEIEEIINDLQRIADIKCYPEDILDGSIAQEWVDYITNLQEELEIMVKDDERSQETIIRLKEENERLNNIIKIMENYLELIYKLVYECDELTEAGDLQNLINELSRYAILGRAYNISEPIYEYNGKKYNILHQELKEKE